MSSSYRSTGTGGAVAVIAVCIIIVVIALIWQRGQRDACERAGGEWVQPYKSRGLCLEPGSVIHP